MWAKSRWFCICLAFGATVTAQSASAQGASAQGGSLMAQCANLLSPTTVALKSNKVAQLAVLRTVQSATHDKGTTNASASVMSYFSGSYGSEQEADRKLSTYDQFNWSDNEFRDYVAAYVPTQAYPAYNSCVNSVLGTPGVHLTIESADSSTLVIRMAFTGSMGATGPYHIQIETKNTDKPLVDLPQVPASGLSREILFQKVDPRKTVVLLANITAGPTVPAGDALRIPPRFVTEAQASVQTLSVRAPDRVVCSGNNNADPREGPEYGPPPPGLDQEFVPAGTQINVVDRGSWDNNQYLSNPPFFRLEENTPNSIRAKTICMPNNPNSQTWLTTEVLYQKKTTTYKVVLAN